MSLKKILKENQKIDIFLSISLDGDNNTHNTIRKNNDAYSNAINTIKELSKVSKKNKKLSLGVNSTYVGSNYQSICKLYEELKSVDLNYVSLNLLRGVTWESKPKGIDINQYKYLCNLKDQLINSKNQQSSLMNSLMISKGKLMTEINAETVQKDHSINNCFAGSLFGVIKDNGDVLHVSSLALHLVIYRK